MELPKKIRLAGTSYCQTNIKKVMFKAWFTLEPEPDNPHDSKAIRVLAYGKLRVGYIPRRIAGELTDMLAEGRAKAMAKFVCKNVSQKYDTQGLTIQIERGPHYEQS